MPPNEHLGEMNNRMTATERRSDDVRAKRNRRKQQSEPKRKNKKRSSRSNRSMPPTITRNKSMAHAPQGKTSRKLARKKYNVALKQPGAEVRLPALPQIQSGWRLISAVFAVAMLWAINMVWTSNNFKVKELEIIGLERLESSEISQFLGLRNQSVFSLDPAQITNSLEQNFKSLKNIQVTLGLPSLVSIELEERIPQLSWTQAGITVWVDEQGIAFEPSGELESIVNVEANQAPLSNEETEEGQVQLLTQEMVQAILSLSALAPEDTTIVYDPEHGLGWSDSRGWIAYFGPDSSDMDLRISMYQDTVDYLTDKGTLPAIISLEYIHQPYYRLQP
jgi:cell division septal protein FtsQ